MVGVLAACVIGAGGFFLWQSSARNDSASSGGMISQASSVPSVTMAAPSIDIVFRITPDPASLTVDGVELPARATDRLRTLRRPAVGKTLTVVAHAKGYEDVTILVDSFTTSPMELGLKPEVAPRASAGGGARPSGKPDAVAKPDPPAKPDSPGVRPRPRPDPNALPANPY